MIMKHCKRKSKINSVFIVEDDNSDKESRRTTRGGMVLAMIASFAGVLTILFNFMKKFSQIILIGNEEFVEYVYLCMYSILCIIILIVIDGLIYAFGDIERYNVKYEKYKEKDENSDSLYNHLIFNIRYAGIVVGVELVSFILIYALYFPFSWFNIFYFVLFLVVCMIATVFIIANRKLIFAKLESLFVFLIEFIIIFCMVAPFMRLSGESKISIKFDNNNIFIENQSSQEYDRMEIKIYNCYNGEEASKYEVYDTEILLAEEGNKKSIGEMEGKISDPSGNRLYWIYEYDIGKAELKPGKYNIIIDVKQGDTELHFENEFIYNKNQVKYAKSEFVKTYK